LKELWKQTTPSRERVFMMSSFTFRVAVAVRPKIGTYGKLDFRMLS